VAWQTWTFTDEEHLPWNVLFFILKKPGNVREYALFVRGGLNEADGASSFSGWSGSSSGSLCRARSH
jgi:hypothetical protein